MVLTIPAIMNLTQMFNHMYVIMSDAGNAFDFKMDSMSTTKLKKKQEKEKHNRNSKRCKPIGTSEC